MGREEFVEGRRWWEVVVVVVGEGGRAWVGERVEGVCAKLVGALDGTVVLCGSFWVVCECALMGLVDERRGGEGKGEGE